CGSVQVRAPPRCSPARRVTPRYSCCSCCATRCCVVQATFGPHTRLGSVSQRAKLRAPPPRTEPKTEPHTEPNTEPHIQLMPPPAEPPPTRPTMCPHDERLEESEPDPLASISVPSVHTTLALRRATVTGWRAVS